MSHLTGPLATKLMVKTANESVTNSTTPQDDDHLFFSIGANETYTFYGFLSINGDAAGDVAYGFTVPSGGLLRWGQHAGQTAAVGSGSLTMNINSNNTSGATVGAAAVGTAISTAVAFWGIVENGSTAGTVQLQWAQRVASATASTVESSSWLKAQRVA